VQVSRTYREVFEALDASVAALTCLPRTEAVIRRALVDLGARGDRDALDDLRCASLRLQMLSAATRTGDRRQRLAATEELKLVARRWMQRLPMH